MLIDYIVADPTGNITVLVTSEVASEKRKEVVLQMFRDVPTCEQVGFIAPVSRGRIRLEMMGGEFCGNATISAAAYQASLDDVDAARIIVESSGVPDPVEVSVKRNAGSDSYVGTLEMSMPAMTYYDYNCGDGSTIKLPVVHLEGISHMLIPQALLSDEAMTSEIKAIAANFDSPAFGMLKYGKTSDGINIRPLVYVAGSDTLVWENGCASGSMAVAYFNYLENDSPVNHISQPGGVITIEFRDGRLFLTGNVTLKK